MNLIPDKPGTTPSYWCTWGIQNYSLLNSTVANADDFATNGFGYAMNNLSESLLFENPGWATNYFAPVRPDLYLMFDVGWDTPPGMPYPQERWRLGSMVVDTKKFPSCTGTPVEQLTKLNQLVRQAGWRGAALWVSPQVPGDNRIPGQLQADINPEVYWRERASWSKAAGIEYWKVDIGARSLTPGFRQMLTQIAHEEAPGLIVEHGRNTGPLNDVPVPWEEVDGQNIGRFNTWGTVYTDSVELVRASDMFRTYDVTPQLSVATTLDRVTNLFFQAHPLMQADRLGLLNCEDEPYLAAGLGCAIGVMRHPLWQERADMDYDPFNYRKRTDEVIRAVRWQRIAPAFGAAETSILLDDTLLTDDWTYKKGDTWADFLVGRNWQQSAPARAVRNMNLPVVEAVGNDVPFVVASRHPNGAISVATLPRTQAGKGAFTPLTRVTLEVGNTTAPVGIFGHYASLTLKFAEQVAGKKVLAQDLAGSEAIDITGRVRAEENTIRLDGKLIEKIGLHSATPGDLSEPGLVLILS